MSRVIKFRAWDKDEKQMVHIDLLRLNWWDGQHDSGWYEDDEGVAHALWADIKEGKLMQYTGLKDKNGKEIYEGDIVDAWSAGSNAKCEVKWGQGSARFFLYRKSGGINWNLSGGGEDYTEETVEVIGNLHENPDLLETK